MNSPTNATARQLIHCPHCQRNISLVTHVAPVPPAIKVPQPVQSPEISPSVLSLEPESDSPTCLNSNQRHNRSRSTHQLVKRG